MRDEGWGRQNEDNVTLPAWRLLKLHGKRTWHFVTGDISMIWGTGFLAACNLFDEEYYSDVLCRGDELDGAADVCKECVKVVRRGQSVCGELTMTGRIRGNV